MGRVEDLSEQFSRHISTPWQRTISGAQRVIVVVYDNELERTMRARRAAFEHATQQAGYKWRELDITDSFAKWMAADDYREEYFASPEDLQLKLAEEFPAYVANLIRGDLVSSDSDEQTVVAVFGSASLFGFSRVSEVVQLIEHEIKGRLVIFFPGEFDRNNYRLLGARDGWNYLAVPITLHREGGVAC